MKTDPYFKDDLKITFSVVHLLLCEYDAKLPMVQLFSSKNIRIQLTNTRILILVNIVAIYFVIRNTFFSETDVRPECGRCS